MIYLDKNNVALKITPKTGNFEESALKIVESATKFVEFTTKLQNLEQFEESTNNYKFMCLVK